MLISPLTKNALKSHEAISGGLKPPRVPMARTMATGPEAAKVNATTALAPWNAAEVRDDLAQRRRARRGPLEGHGYAGRPTTASISTFMPGIASALTSTSVLAGRASPKNSRRTGLMRARSPMSVR